MSSQGEAFYQKRVTLAELDIPNFKFPQMSKQARRLVLQYHLSSVEGLIDENWETEARRLTENRWTAP